MKNQHSAQVDTQRWLSSLRSTCALVAQRMLERRAADAALSISYKPDGSPVCAADTESAEMLEQALGVLTPGVALISEEDTVAHRAQTFWLIDPLDGTREYLAGRDAFSINLALVADTKVVFGLIYYPVTATCWWAARGQGAFCGQQPLRVKRVAEAPAARLLVSGREPAQVIERWSAGLAGLGWVGRPGWQAGIAKLCAVAAGEAVLHARVSACSAWDIAAGQLLVEEAGGLMVDDAGQPLRYCADGDDNWDAPPYLAGSREAVEACLSRPHSV